MRLAGVVDLPDGGAVECWVDLTAVRLPFVSFRWTHVFLTGGDVVVSDSTLRFRTRREVELSLAAENLSVVDVRDAPDRPGRELVFIAEREAADHTAE